MIAFDSVKQANEILSDENNKELIHKKICEIIFNSIDKLVNSIQLFYYEKEDITHYVDKSNFINILNVSLLFFQEIENYEYCNIIFNYIKILENEN